MSHNVNIRVRQCHIFKLTKKKNSNPDATNIFAGYVMTVCAVSNGGVTLVLGDAAPAVLSSYNVTPSFATCRIDASPLHIRARLVQVWPNAAKVADTKNSLTRALENYLRVVRLNGLH
jgi:hypothetical protein